MKQLKLTVFSVMAASVLSLVGCQTISGLGKDVQAGGKMITKASHRHSDKRSN